MNVDINKCLIALFGASGWGVAIIKIILDFREDARKTREDERKARETKTKTAEQIAPFIRELNSAEYLKLFKQIKKNSKYQDDGSLLSPDEMRKLRNYPAKMEEIGALMMAGKLSRPEIYDSFGEDILACDYAEFLWEGEDLHFWKVFKLLASAMEQERIGRAKSHAGG